MANTQLVVFELAGNEYGFDAFTVNGILRAKKFNIQKIPGLPLYIEGVIQLRGKVSYIFNLKTKLGIEDNDICDESKFIMINIGENVAGCIVDEVTDIVSFDTKDIQLPPAFAQKDAMSYMKGIGRIEDRMVVLLNPEKVISLAECFNIDKINDAVSSLTATNISSIQE